MHAFRACRQFIPYLQIHTQVDSNFELSNLANVVKLGQGT